MKRIKNFKSKTINSSEQGVTLLLTVMILAGLTLITLSIGAFAIQSLRNSRATLITEPAIAAAESGGEQGLWAIKRNTSFTSCLNSTLSNNALTSSCESFGDATFDIKANVPYIFYLYDPNDINGDVDLSHCTADAQGSTQCYKSLTVNYVTGTDQVNVSVERLDNSTTNLNPSNTVVTGPGNSQTITIGAVPTNTEGRMKVTLTSSGDVTVDVTTNRGMPEFPTIDSSGCSARVAIQSCDSNNQEIYSRRINISVPQ